MRRVRRAALKAAALFGPTAALALGADVAAAQDRLPEAHAALKRDRSLQWEFEAVPPPPASRPGPRWLAELLEAFGPLLELVFWAGVAVIAILTVWLLVRRAQRRLRERKPRTPAATALVLPPDPARVRTLLAEADRLAAEGAFAEAVRLLLFRGVDEIRDQRPDLFRQALTSREIAGLTALPETARRHFGAIAAIVERSFFGGRPLDGEGWAQARRAYGAFAARESWA